NIRAYNSIFAFTSMGVKLDESLADDQHVYNKLTASQVAAIWVEGHDSIEYTKHDIVVQSMLQ
ncbi:322_t:CDS:2, partial [Gigaspora margarita]